MNDEQFLQEYESDRRDGLSHKEASEYASEAAARLKHALADNARLRDALRPFAAAWEFEPDYCDDHEIRRFDGDCEYFLHTADPSEETRLTMAAFRAAHLALHPDETGGEDE